MQPSKKVQAVAQHEFNVRVSEATYAVRHEEILHAGVAELAARPKRPYTAIILGDPTDNPKDMETFPLEVVNRLKPGGAAFHLSNITWPESLMTKLFKDSVFVIRLKQSDRAVKDLPDNQKLRIHRETFYGHFLFFWKFPIIREAEKFLVNRQWRKDPKRFEAFQIVTLKNITTLPANQAA